MTTAKKICGSVAVLVVLFLVSGDVMALEIPSDAASALSQEFETVFYSRADLLSGSHASKELSKLDGNALRMPFAYFLSALDSLGKGVANNVLAEGDSVLVGAKNFRPPGGLGSVASQSCYVIVLGRKKTVDFRKFIHQSSMDSADRFPIWNWTAKLGEFGENDTGPSSVYATQISSSYILICNDREELQRVTKLLTSTASGSQSVPELEAISQYSVWGYRLYRHSELNHSAASGMTYVTPTAKALILFFDSAQNVCVLRLLASDTSTVDKINAKAMFPPLRPVSSGVWETKIPLKGDESTSERIGTAMWLFGFGVYL